MHWLPSLKLTASLHLKMEGWKTSFVFGWPIFRGKLLVLGSVIMNNLAHCNFPTCSTWRNHHLQPKVKLGQILSCREDLVPKEYINELTLGAAGFIWKDCHPCTVDQMFIYVWIDFSKYKYIYIYTWNLFVLCFGGWTLQKQAFSNQNEGHLGSMCIYNSSCALTLEALGKPDVQQKLKLNRLLSWKSCEILRGGAYMVTNRPAKPVLKKNPTYSRRFEDFAHQEYCWECTGEYSTVFNYFFFLRKFTHGSASTVDYMHWLIYIIYIYLSSFSFTSSRFNVSTFPYWFNDS